MTQRRYKREIETPMLAGQEPGGGLWFAALFPIRDLFKDEDVRDHLFLEFLYRVAFVEVRTDPRIGIVRSPGRGGAGCCIVDFFLTPPEHQLITLKVTRRIEAEWGQMYEPPVGGEEPQERTKRWRSQPLSFFMKAADAPLTLMRFTVDEEGVAWSTKGGWVAQAAQMLRYTLRAFYDYGLNTGRTRLGVFTLEGAFSYAEVADYFLRLAER